MVQSSVHLARQRNLDSAKASIRSEIIGGGVREIKFRAWDKRMQKMIYPNVCNRWVGAEHSYYPIVIESYEIAHPFDFDLMQFTGLRDKNGKEIYEGDIVTTGTDSPRTIVVMYDEEKAAFNSLERGEPLWIYGRANDAQREVIGNIHENPEMVK